MNGFYSKIGNVSIYLEYVDAIKETVKSGLPNDFDNLREQFGYKVTDVRLIELVIFSRQTLPMSKSTKGKAKK